MHAFRWAVYRYADYYNRYINVYLRASFSNYRNRSSASTCCSASIDNGIGFHFLLPCVGFFFKEAFFVIVERPPSHNSITVRTVSLAWFCTYCNHAACIHYRPVDWSIRDHKQIIVIAIYKLQRVFICHMLICKFRYARVNTSKWRTEVRISNHATLINS